MRSNNKGLAIAALTLAMVVGGGADAQPNKAISAHRASDAPITLGEPYSVAGVTYTPSDPAYYDEVGFAGLSDGGSKGDITANGEAFAPAAVTAAHKTLPLPSYVEVTALDTGKTILVRVNDRGPMRNDQLIALSPGAAAQLGVNGAAFPIRVRRVNPPEQERAALRSQRRAAERLETPAALLKVLRGKLPAGKPAAAPASLPNPKVAVQSVKTRPGVDFDKPAPSPAAAKPKATPPTPKPVTPTPAATPPRKGGYVVQVGAFSARARAETVAKSIGAHVEQGGNLWRVRLGPYPTRQAAEAGGRAAAAKGFENARVMANDAQ